MTMEAKQKKIGVIILKSDKKIDLKIQNIARDKEGHYIMIKIINIWKWSNKRW